MSEERPGSKMGSSVWLGIAVVAGILVLGDLSARMSNARRLEREAAVARTEVASLEAENASLRTQIAQVTSGALVEGWARGEARMVLPGEQLVIPLAPGESAPGSNLSEGLQVEGPRPWDVWWELLFGG